MDAKVSGTMGTLAAPIVNDAKKMINLLNIIYLNPNSKNRGGIENYAVSLSKFLEMYGVKTTFVYVKDYLKEKFDDSDIEIKIPDIPIFRKLVYNIKLYLLLKNDIALKKYDAIVINGDNGVFLSSIKNVKTIFILHGSSLQSIFAQLKKGRFNPAWLLVGIISGFLEIYAYKNSKFLFSVSRNTIIFMNKFYKRNDFLIAPPIPPPTLNKKIESRNNKTLRKAMGFDENSLICIFVGKDPKRKGLSTAINAVKGKVGVILIIVGPEIQLKKLPPNCKYYGIVDNQTLENLYNISDVLLFPSTYEGFPTVIIEAMTYGVVPIVYNKGPFNEIVTNDNGYLASNEKDFSKILDNILGNKDELELKKNLCKMDAKKFTADNIFKKYLEILNKQISKKFLY